MANLRGSVRAYTNGQLVSDGKGKGEVFRLARDEIHLEATTFGAKTKAGLKLFADGSGVLTVYRGDHYVMLRLTPETELFGMAIVESYPLITFGADPEGESSDPRD